MDVKGSEKTAVNLTNSVISPHFQFSSQFGRKKKKNVDLDGKSLTPSIDLYLEKLFILPVVLYIWGNAI